MYINCHSHFSLRYGTLSPERLVAEAHQRGVQTLALTDISNTSGAFPFVKACEKVGIKPILGIEFRLEGKLLYIGLAQNMEGWAQLNQFYNTHELDHIPLPSSPPSIPNVYFIYPPGQIPPKQLREHEFIGIRQSMIGSLFQAPILAYRDKLILWQPLTFLDHDGFRLHKLLRAIDLNIIITKLQETDHALADECFLPEGSLEAIYALYPDMIANTQWILDHCEISLKSTSQHNRQSFTGSIDGDMTLLQKLALNGCKRRYGPNHPAALQRVEKELKVIKQLGFAPYFLITWDIVRYAHTSGYYHVGRGSGANSIVAFCLYITDVDPLELDLYFERFINPYRSSPPDFDLDFSWDERDDVLDYILKRYGKTHAALLATYNTFKGKSIIRELGKVFGLPKEEIDHIIEESIRPTGRVLHPWAKHLVRFGKQMEGMPNYLSIHAGGCPHFRKTTSLLHFTDPNAQRVSHCSV